MLRGVAGSVPDVIPSVAMSNPLKAYREAKGLSQQEVADKLGVSRPMVGFLENGEREFTLDTALKCRDLLGIPLAKTLPQIGKTAA